MMRSLVSKKKKRFEEDGFDLDLTYITDKIIAMGFPSTGSEASYRNPVGEVQKFFNMRHRGHVSRRRGACLVAAARPERLRPAGRQAATLRPGPR